MAAVVTISVYGDCAGSGRVDGILSKETQMTVPKKWPSAELRDS
jgi:hypothetical protein